MGGILEWIIKEENLMVQIGFSWWDLVNTVI